MAYACPSPLHCLDRLEADRTKQLLAGGASIRGRTRVGTETCANKDIEAVKFAFSINCYGKSPA
jgi:hypothetical protein